MPGLAVNQLRRELSDVLLTGQRAMPDKAQALGYTFRHPTLEPALRAVLA